MKKIFFALAALVLAFTGCSQEEDAIQVSEKKAVKVVVNMDKPGFGEDTRAARTGWEDGDQVIVALNYDSDIYTSGYIKLIYNVTDGKGAWTTEFWEYGGKTSSSDFIDNLYDKFFTDGSVKAAYFSSGVKSVGIPSLNITTNASDASLGECVMTCEDGEYSVSGDVLTLDITMIPQVAQFTIKDLSAGEDDYTVEYAGTMTAYAGGTITPAGVELNPVGEPFDPYGAWVHDNEDGISIYASPWQEVPDGFDEMDKLELVGGLGYFLFIFYDADDYDYYREFPGKNTLKNGDAVIMDGPYTDGAEDKWVEPV